MKISDKIYSLSQIYTNAKIVFPYFDRIKYDMDQKYIEFVEKMANTTNNKDFILYLLEFIALYNDGHTDITLPIDIKRLYGFLPFEILQIESDFFIKSKAENIDIPLYSKIESINDTSIYDLVETLKKYTHTSNGYFYKGKLESLIPLFVNYKNNTIVTDKGTHTFDLSDVPYSLQGKSLELKKFKRILTKMPNFEFSMIENIAYFKIDTFAEAGIIQKVLDILNRINNISSIIIDVRENNGGMTSYASKIASLFVDGKFSSSKKRTRLIKGIDYASASQYKRFSQERLQELLINNLTTKEELEKANLINKNLSFDYYTDSYVGNKQFDIPLILLTSKNTISASEDFVLMLKNYPKCIIIGTETYGSTGTPLMLDLPFNIKARICSVGYQALDGTDFINKGIKPNLTKGLTIEDYRQNYDRVLDLAVEFIKRRILAKR